MAGRLGRLGLRGYPRAWPFVAAASMAAVLLAGCGEDAGPRGPVPGDMVPDVVLERIDGVRVPLSDYRGRLLVLNVWATWCSPCRREMPSLERLGRTAGDGMAVAGLSMDEDRNLLLEFLQRHGITFANFSDAGTRVARSVLGVESLPQTLLVAPDGRLAGRIVGERDWDSPSVRAKLDEARRGAAVSF